MARDVRVVDSPGYLGGGGIRPGVEVMEIDGRLPYRRRWTGREPLVLILILTLVVIWVYRNFGDEVFFGRHSGLRTPESGNAPPVEIETAPVVPPVAPVEEPPTVAAEQRPVIAAEQQSAVIAAEQQSDIMGYSRVMAERLNLREGPGYERRVISVLPRDWEVAILRQSHITPNGDVWVEVMAQTDDGWREGWVMRQYLESCNCPMP